MSTDPLCLLFLCVHLCPLILCAHCSSVSTDPLCPFLLCGHSVFFCAQSPCSYCYLRLLSCHAHCSSMFRVPLSPFTHCSYVPTVLVSTFSLWCIPCIPLLWVKRIECVIISHPPTPVLCCMDSFRFSVTGPNFPFHTLIKVPQSATMPLTRTRLHVTFKNFKYTCALIKRR